MTDGHDAFRDLFLRSNVATVNYALEAAGNDLRLVDKLANELRFRAGGVTFLVTEQEMLATELSMLEFLQVRLEEATPVADLFETPEGQRVEAIRAAVVKALSSLAESRVRAETIQMANETFTLVSEFLEDLSLSKGQIHTYDMFLGLRMVRGDLNLVLTAPEFGQYRLLDLS
jgi:hypothetical protein